MSFTSLQFIVFLAVTVFGYYIVPKKLQWLFLLLASYVFYLSGGIRVLWYILFTTLTSFAGGLLLGKAGRTKDKKIKLYKKLIVATVLILNFSLLFAVKYWNFTADIFALPRLNLIIPLGLSFYMFQSMGYVIDCYRAKYEPQRNFLKFALFVSFFPQLIQGPISRYDDLGDQLTSAHPFDADSMKYGLQLVMWGYMKKLIVADRACVIVNTVFGDHTAYGGAITAFSVLFYCIQLYCDFSGGIDITCGVSQMLGIRLADNFRRPIFAISLTDYWRRWHITLGTWMKDYIFYPISLSKPFARLGKFTRKKIGSKLGKIIPTSLATFIIYFIIGIWHGANFRYIAYGFYNGIIITASLLMTNVFFGMRQKLNIRDEDKKMRVFRIVRTWIIVFIGRYITRAPSLMSAVWMLKNTALHPHIHELFGKGVLALGLSVYDIIVVFAGVAVILVIEYLQERGIEIRKTLEKKSAAMQWLVLVAMLSALLVFGIMRDGYIQSEFIYKQF